MQRKKKKENKIRRLLFFLFFRGKDFKFYVNRSYFFANKKTIVKSRKIIEILIRHSNYSVFWIRCSKKCWSWFMCLRAYKRTGIFSKSLHLGIFNVRLLGDHSLSFSIFLIIEKHLIKSLNFDPLLCKPIPATSNYLWHVIWLTACSILFRLNLFSIHFILESFCLQLKSFVTYCAVSKRLFSFTSLNWFFKYAYSRKFIILAFLLKNFRQSFNICNRIDFFIHSLIESC